MRIRATLRCMASSEIMQMIPAEKLAEIRRRDPSPMFKAFVVGHEGEARGNLIGVGNIVKRWFRSAVEKLHEKISGGLQLFHGHAQTNDTTGRVPIGEVAGKKLLSIKDKFSSVVACYIYPSFRHLPLDVASIEADVDLQQDAKAGLFVADVNGVTGIALGNSEIETPGFPGATLLGQLQAFAKHKTSHVEENMEITIEDVKTFLKAEKIPPSDLFGADALADDPAVKGIVRDATKEAVTGEYAHRKRTEEGFDKTRKELEAKVQEKEDKIKQLLVETAKTQIGPLLEKQKETRKLDEKQVKFIQIRLPKFAPQKPDELEKEFNAYLDSEVDEYGKLAKELGIEMKPVENGDDKGKKAGTGSESGKNEGGGGDDKYTNPAKNPLIKTD